MTFKILFCFYFFTVIHTAVEDIRIWNLDDTTEKISSTNIPLTMTYPVEGDSSISLTVEGSIEGQKVTYQMYFGDGAKKPIDFILVDKVYKYGDYLYVCPKNYGENRLHQYDTLYKSWSNLIEIKGVNDTIQCSQQIKKFDSGVEVGYLFGSLIGAKYSYLYNYKKFISGMMTSREDLCSLYGTTETDGSGNYFWYRIHIDSDTNIVFSRPTNNLDINSNNYKEATTVKNVKKIYGTNPKCFTTTTDGKSFQTHILTYNPKISAYNITYTKTKSYTISDDPSNFGIQESFTIDLSTYFPSFSLNEVYFLTDFNYLAFQGKYSGALYWGIMDINEQEIIFLSNQALTQKYYVKDSEPSLLINSDGVYYVVCPFVLEGTVCKKCGTEFLFLDNYGKNKCVPTCPENSRLSKNSKICTCKKGYKYSSADDKCLPLCYKNCKTCDKPYDSLSDMKCTSCPDNSIRYKNNCYPEKNSVTKSFILPNGNEGSCHQINNNYYIQKGSYECTDSLPENAYLLNINTGLYDLCDPSCKTCITTKTICTSCNPDSTNKYLLNNQCTTGCGDGYTAIKESSGFVCNKCFDFCKTCEQAPIKNQNKILSMECKSCKEQIDGQKVITVNKKQCFLETDSTKKYFDTSMMDYNPPKKSCTEFNQYIYENSYECIDKPENAYVYNENLGLIRECDPACASCKGPATNDNKNCIKCVSLYVKKGNCVSACSYGDFVDEENRRCYNCFENCQDCIDEEIYSKNSEGKSIISQMRCTKCNSGLIKVDDFCFPILDGPNKSFDAFLATGISNNEKFCSDYKKVIFEDTYECITKPNNTYYLNKDKGIVRQCHKDCASCTDGPDGESKYCIQCKDQTLYEYKGNCVKTCPPYYEPKVNQHNIKVCREVLAINLIDINIDNLENLNNGCKKSEFQYNMKLVSDSRTVEEVFRALTQRYIYDPALSDTLLNNEYSNLVDLSYFSEDDRVSFTYTNSSCAAEIAKKNGLDYMDLTNCLDKLNEIESNNKKPLVVAQFYNNASLNYYIVNNKGEEVDLSPCDQTKIQVTHSITDDQDKLDKLKHIQDLGVDIYDSDSDFFNDVCFTYTSEDGMDVGLTARREQFFVNSSICQDGCTHESTDIETGRVTCNCSLSTSDSGGKSSNNEFKNILNNVLEDFPIDINLENFKIFKCANLVFDGEYLKKNAGFYFLLFFLLAQIPEFVLFYKIRFKPIYKFIYKENVKENIPQIDIKELDETFCEEDAKITNETEEEEGKNKEKNNEDVEISKKNIDKIFNMDKIINMAKKEIKKKEKKRLSKMFLPNKAVQSSNKISNKNVKSPSSTFKNTDNKIEDNKMEDLDKKLGKKEEDISNMKSKRDEENKSELGLIVDGPAESIISIEPNNCLDKNSEISFNSNEFGAFDEQDKKPQKKMSVITDNQKKRTRNIDKEFQDNTLSKLNLDSTYKENAKQENHENIEDINKKSSKLESNKKKEDEKEKEIKKESTNEIKKEVSKESSKDNHNNGNEKNFGNFRQELGENFSMAQKELNELKKKRKSMAAINVNNSVNKFKTQVYKYLNERLSIIKDKKEKNVPDDDELDELDYEDAIIYEKRNICIYYLRLLKNKLILVNCFTNYGPFQPFIIKLIGFFLTLSVFFVVTAFFFDETYISERYSLGVEADGIKYILENELDKSIYTSFAALIVDMLLNNLQTVKKKYDILVEKEKDSKVFVQEMKRILKNYKLKLIFFFVLDIILMFVFWYYCTAWCCVYRNTQKDYLWTCLISGIFALLLYSALYLAVALLRYIGLWMRMSILFTISQQLADLN